MLLKTFCLLQAGGVLTLVMRFRYWNDICFVNVVVKQQTGLLPYTCRPTAVTDLSVVVCVCVCGV